MKRAALFVLLAIALDAGWGVVLHALYSRTQSGDHGLVNHALTRDADVLVLGSSRAQFQVMPSVLKRRLGLSAYNAGLKGQDFLAAVMLHDLWKRRHPRPRAIVLTVNIESLVEREAELAAAQIMAPHLDDSPLVREVLYSDGPFKRYEYLSRAYRYNGKLFSILKHQFEPEPADYDGFAISPGNLDPRTDTGVLNALDQTHTQRELAELSFSTRKLAYLSALARETAAGGGQLFLLHTPLYRQDDAAHALWMNKLRAATRELAGVEIVNLCTATRPDVFAGKPELYRNLNHLNARGAEALSELLADALEKSLVRRTPDEESARVSGEQPPLH